MEKEKDAYTILVLPSPTSQPRRFSIKKRTLRYFASFSLFFIILILGGGTHYFLILGDLSELKTLRREVRLQRIQIQSFSDSISKLRHQVIRLEELDTKIRAITDIPPKEEPQAFGQGGAEGIGLEKGESEILSGEGFSQKIAEEMRWDLVKLTEQARQQEHSFQELGEAMKERRARWASTPSIWPVRGMVSSEFGMRISPLTGGLAPHHGIDIVTRRGTQVMSPAGGVVLYVGSDSGLGKAVKINHGYGIRTLYGHLSKTAVKIGQRVRRGEVIGFVGSTGLSTGPHLHYEVYANNIPVNPRQYILD